MNKRQIDLLKQLITQDEYLPIKYFSKIFNVSMKTISKDLNDIQKFINPTGANIERKQGLGIKLNYTKSQLHKLNKQINSVKMSNCDNLLDNRRIQILLSLLINSNEYTTIQKLSDKYIVSRTSINNDLNKIEEKLSKYNLKLSKTLKGTKVVGSEINIRKALVNTIQEYSKINPSYITEYQNIRHDELRIKEINAILNEKATSFLESLLNRIEKKLKLVIYEPYYTNLLTHLVIMTNRIMNGNYIESSVSSNDIALVINEDLYNAAVYIIKEIEKEFKVKINAKEIGYIYKYLISIRLSYDDKKKSDSREIDLPYICFTNNLIDILSQMSDMNYSLKTTLYERLLLHIKPMLNRLKYNIQIKNPLLKGFLKEFKEQFFVLKVACLLVCNRFKLNMISDDEVAYILSYFISENEKVIEAIKIKTIVICHSGYGTSQLLATRLEKTFNNMEVVDIISSNSMANGKLEKADLIISTVSVNITINKPHLIVSAFLEEADKKNIKNYIDLILESKRKLTSDKCIEQISLTIVDNKKDIQEFMKSLNKDYLIHIKDDIYVYIISSSQNSVSKYILEDKGIIKCIFAIVYSNYKYLSKALRKIIREWLS